MCVYNNGYMMGIRGFGFFFIIFQNLLSYANRKSYSWADAEFVYCSNTVVGVDLFFIFYNKEEGKKVLFSECYVQHLPLVGVEDTVR